MLEHYKFGTKDQSFIKWRLHTTYGRQAVSAILKIHWFNSLQSSYWCELLIIRVHMTYISERWLQTVYILVCVLCTVCILCTEGRQYAQFWKYANCCVITARRAASVGWCWTGRETEVDRWGDCNMHSLGLDQSLINMAFAYYVRKAGSKRNSENTLMVVW